MADFIFPVLIFLLAMLAFKDLSLKMEETMPDQEVFKEFNNGCKRGNHSLIEIWSSGSEDEKKVVRWCEICGAIVVDTDVDNRTAPGDVMPMRLPKLREAV